MNLLGVRITLVAGPTRPGTGGIPMQSPATSPVVTGADGFVLVVSKGEPTIGSFTKSGGDGDPDIPDGYG